MITYKDLLKRLNELSEAQLEDQVLIFDRSTLSEIYLEELGFYQDPSSDIPTEDDQFYLVITTEI